MPWDLVHNHPACRRGEWAVVNRQADREGRHSIERCHPTRERALAHQRALYAKEPQAHSREVQTMNRKTLVVPVQWKTASAADDPGTLEGHASIFGNADLGGDVVMPGAFKKTLADWARSKRRIPLLVDHKMSTDGVIGSVDHAEEDAVGLAFRARFSSIQKAQDIRTLLREQHIDGLSFTYEEIRARPGTKAGEPVRFLDELRVFEFTVTPFPMNILAIPTGVKGSDGKAVSNRPWSDFTQADYTDEQWARACLIDTGQGEGKQRYSLPVREPSGALNRNGVHAAAARLNQVQVSADKKATAARALIRLYGELGEDPPDSLRRIAGRSAAAMGHAQWADAMRKALDLPYGPASKAAAAALLDAYDPTLDVTDDTDLTDVAGPADTDGSTAPEAASTDGTPQDAGPHMAASTPAAADALQRDSQGENPHGYAEQILADLPEPPSAAPSRMTPEEMAGAAEAFSDMDRTRAEIDALLKGVGSP